MRTWKLKTAAAGGFYEGPSVQQFDQGAREFRALQRFGQYSRHTGSNRSLRQHGTAVAADKQHRKVGCKQTQSLGQLSAGKPWHNLVCNHCGKTFRISAQCLQRRDRVTETNRLVAQNFQHFLGHDDQSRLIVHDQECLTSAVWSHLWQANLCCQSIGTFWQIQGESGSMPQSALHVDGTAELGNHAVYHCQPQTGAIICAILSMAALALSVG
jgi:hypothetical protein